jgi:DNA-binding NarL/FixJ family response regulator
MKKKIRLFIIEDREIIRDSLKFYLSGIDDIELVGEADNGYDAINKLESTEADVILTDISMPVMDGYETVTWLKAKKPHLRILVMSINNNLHSLIRMCSYGVTGFYLKDEGLGKLPVAIRHVAEGWYFLSDRIHYSIVSKEQIIRTYLLPAIADYRRNIRKKPAA